MAAIATSAPSPPGDRIETVRAFNRFVTRRFGALRPDFLGTDHTLPEARLLFELSRADATEAGDLREALELDSGYLSRLLTRLEGAGLLERRRSESDGRRQTIALTSAGRERAAELERRATEQVGGVLAALPETDQRRLVGAMAAVQAILGGGASDPTVVLRPLEPGDPGWIIARHGALYASEYGWDETMEALVARIVADFVEGHDPRRERAWIAELDGRRVGSILLVAKGAETAKLRLLLVEPSARGHGIGARLVDECLRFARRAGYARVELWTQSILTSAHRIYEAAGFELVAEEPHRSFGVDLVGQTWARDL